MSEIDRFWQYAREALLSVIHAKSDEDKQGLLELLDASGIYTSGNPLIGRTPSQLYVVNFEQTRLR